MFDPQVRRNLAVAVSTAFAGLALVTSSPVLAQRRAPAPADLGVDRLDVKGGPHLLGVIVRHDEQGAATISVERAWLKQAHPAYYDQKLAEETAAHRARTAELLTRMTQWEKQRAGDDELAFFLRKERERLENAAREKPGQPLPASQFLLLDIAPNLVERVMAQPPQRRQVALIAWRERLNDVERRSVADLVRELQRKGVPLTNEPIDLTDRLPDRSDSEVQWAARRAIVEYQYRKSLDFQGTGGMLVPVGDKDQPPPVEQLIAAIFKDQLAGQLADLLDPPAGGANKPPDVDLTTAAKAAEKADVIGFRVTRLDANVANRQGRVETRFVVQRPGKGWQTVWSNSVAIDPAKAGDEATDRIANDPQVKQSLALLKLAGLDENEFRAALRFGAAVMQAQQIADARFFEFRDRYLARLDGPPLN